MVLTWIGIAFMVLVLVAWIVYENRRLITYAAARRGDGRRAAAGNAQGSECRHERKQIEFPPKQTHVRSFELAMLAICIICVVIVLIIVLGTDLGDEFRPTN